MKVFSHDDLYIDAEVLDFRWEILIYLLKGVSSFQKQWAEIKCDALRDLVPFVQLKKHEKHPWGSVTFSKVAGFLQFILL